MSAPHTILDNLPSLCQNCQIWWKFDVVITKIILLVFWRHGVYCRMLGYHAMKKFRQIMRFATVYNTGLWKNYGRTDRLTETSRQKILRTCTRRAYTENLNKVSNRLNCFATLFYRKLFNFCFKTTLYAIKRHRCADIISKENTDFGFVSRDSRARNLLVKQCQWSRRSCALKSSDDVCFANCDPHPEPHRLPRERERMEKDEDETLTPRKKAM